MQKLLHFYNIQTERDAVFLGIAWFGGRGLRFQISYFTNQLLVFIACTLILHSWRYHLSTENN